MTWEHSMLRVLSERPHYNELKQLANNEKVSEDVKDCVRIFGAYFFRNPSSNRIVYGDIVKWMETTMKIDTEEDKNKHHLRCLLLHQVFSEDLTDESVEDTRTQLVELCYNAELAEVVTTYNDGMLEEDLMEVTEELSIKYSSLMRKNNLSPIRKDIETILREQDDDNGLTLPLDGLNKTVAPQKEGDFLVIGAMNNTGKTALAVQIAVNYAKQLPPDSKILYLNNEGIGDHIILRTRQIALDLGKYALEEAFNSGMSVEENYHKAINGDAYKIEVIDVHGINVSQIQSLLRLHKPAVVIYDMLDAVSGFGGSGMDVDRYKQLYSWARAQCANPEYRHIGVALTQAAHQDTKQGETTAYLPKHALEYSRGAKQAQADVLIMVGMVEENPLIRYIWTPRCKRTKRGRTESDSKFMCSFDPDVGIYVDKV